MKKAFRNTSTLLVVMAMLGILGLHAQEIPTDSESIEWKTVWIPKVDIAVGYQNQHRVNGLDLVKLSRKKHKVESEVVTQEIKFEWWKKRIFAEFSGVKSLDEDWWAKAIYESNDRSSIDEEVYSSYEVRLGFNCDEFEKYYDLSLTGGFLFAHYAKAYSNFKEYDVDDPTCTMSASYFPEDSWGLFIGASYQFFKNEKWLHLSSNIGVEWYEKGNRLLAQVGLAHTLPFSNFSESLEKFTWTNTLAFFFYGHDFWEYTEKYVDGEATPWTQPGKYKNGSKAGIGLSTLKSSLNYDVSDHIGL